MISELLDVLKKTTSQRFICVPTQYFHISTAYKWAYKWAEIINNKFPNKSEYWYWYWWKKFVRELDYLSTTQASYDSQQEKVKVYWPKSESAHLSTTQASSGSLVLLKLWADWDRAAALSWNEIWILIRFLYFFLMSFTVEHKIKIKGQASKLLWKLFFHESLSIKARHKSNHSSWKSLILTRFCCAGLHLLVTGVGRESLKEFW